MSQFRSVLHSRIASQHFDDASPIPEEMLFSIIEDSAQAPSSFNLQHWRYIAITDQVLKERLACTTLASNRERVLAAPLSVLIVGDTEAHLELSDILNRCVTAGSLARDTADEWLAFAAKTYSEIPVLARDEAIRSCSLAAMAFMLSATNKGLKTCPVGFNTPEVIRILDLPDRYVPVIWIILGNGNGLDHMRRPRLGLRDILSFNRPPV